MPVSEPLGFHERSAGRAWPTSERGGTWEDEKVVVHEAGPNVMASPRKPDDLPAFIDRMISVVSA